MRVGIVIDLWEPTRGGAERALAKLIGHLVRAGHEAHVFALRIDIGAPGVPHVVERPRSLRGAMERTFGRRAVAAAHEAGCDVTLGIRHLEEIAAYWPHGGLLRPPLAAGEPARGGVGGGLSRALHRVSLKHRAFLRLETTLLGDGGARAVWCVSPMIRDEIAAAFPGAAPRLEVHPNGVDLAAFHPGLRDERRDAFLRRHLIDSASAVVVFPGGNWGLKGWDLLWQALPSAQGPWMLVAAGRGSEFVTTPRGVRERVVLLPRQDPRDLWAVADLCVQPTWRDPCSLATLEALASGVPVVTTAANGASDAVMASGVGAVVPTGDAPALAAAITAAVARRGPEARRAARDAVADRPETAWLDGLVASLERVAAAR